MPHPLTMALLSVFVVAHLASAGDVSGTWRDEFKGPDGKPAVQILELVVNGKTVTGTFTNALGGKRAIRDGEWDGTTLRFWVPWDNGDSDKCQAVGRLSADTLLLDLKTSRWRQKRSFRKSVEK